MTHLKPPDALADPLANIPLEQELAADRPDFPIVEGQITPSLDQWPFRINRSLHSKGHLARRSRTSHVAHQDDENVGGLK